MTKDISEKKSELLKSLDALQVCFDDLKERHIQYFRFREQLKEIKDSIDQKYWDLTRLIIGCIDATTNTETEDLNLSQVEAFKKVIKGVSEDIDGPTVNSLLKILISKRLKPVPHLKNLGNIEICSMIRENTFFDTNNTDCNLQKGGHTKTHLHTSKLLWTTVGLLIFFVLFVIDLLTPQSVQLWIGDYHIHHSLLGVVLVVISVVIIIYKWKKREPIPRIIIFALFFGIFVIVEWGLVHYTECGGRYLLITKNE